MIYEEGTKVMKVILAVVAAVIIAIIGVVAPATAAVKDPRVCSYGPARKADCARQAAVLAARKTLQTRSGQRYLWQGPMTCTAAGSLLRWRCWFTSRLPQVPANGYVAVVYKATAKGWTVKTAVVAV